MNLYLSPRLFERLHGFAEEMGITPTTLARIAIAGHLDDIAEKRGMVHTDRLNREALDQLKLVKNAARNVLEGTPGRRRRS